MDVRPRFLNVETDIAEPEIAPRHQTPQAEIVTQSKPISPQSGRGDNTLVIVIVAIVLVLIVILIVYLIMHPSTPAVTPPAPSAGTSTATPTGHTETPTKEDYAKYLRDSKAARQKLAQEALKEDDKVPVAKKEDDEVGADTVDAAEHE